MSWWTDIIDRILMPKEKIPEFIRALQFTLQWEGGYVNDPRDPGGETKWGISKRAHPYIDIKDLTKEAAECIYKQDYWLKAGCHKLRWPLNMVVFDAAVNVGITGAKRFLRKADSHHDIIIFALNVIKERENYYRRLVKKNIKFKVYLKGWLNRTRALKHFILKGK